MANLILVRFFGRLVDECKTSVVGCKAIGTSLGCAADCLRATRHPSAERRRVAADHRPRIAAREKTSSIARAPESANGAGGHSVRRPAVGPSDRVAKAGGGVVAGRPQLRARSAAASPNPGWAEARRAG